MSSRPAVPGLYFTADRPVVEPSPLRSDVAGFIGRTRRGPVCGPADVNYKPVRVEGWREYLSVFGGLAADAVMTYAIRGYFENEGEVAYIIRLAHPSVGCAKGRWQIGELDEGGNWTADSPQAFEYTSYSVVASSPGAWANDTRVMIHYRLRRLSEKSALPLVDLCVVAPDEPVEYLTGIPAAQLVQEVEARSQLIRLIPDGQKAARSDQTQGPHSLDYELTLQGGLDADTDQTPGKQEYLSALTKMGDESEVALVAVPGLYDDVQTEADQMEILAGLIKQAEELRDRMVIVDVPTDEEDGEEQGLALKQVPEILGWAGRLRDEAGFTESRAAAIYHPRLSVPDPLGGIRQPLRNVPPSGHLAGVISRLDRQRGAHHTPANTPIFEAVDITQRFDPSEQAQFNDAGINLLRCFAGNWLQVWGGRTLSQEQRFIAHRRLIHRLVRAIRRVAEPLVFDINGPEMWLTLARSITTVLLEAWRAGALKGARPEEAFQVRCDETLNPPEAVDLGQVHCEIELAPATPMEFILLRVSLSGDGRLEVFES